MQIEKTWNAWHLAVEIVPPSDTCRQGHHRRLAPSGTCPPPAEMVLLILDVRGIQGFGDTSKVELRVGTIRARPDPLSSLVLTHFLGFFDEWSSEKTWNAWHLAVEIVPPSDTCRQGHHRRLAPSGTCPPPGDLEA
ncbi:hypothetical protein DEO72_LG11g2216 [Vigna unguiculata]|uniref:Uncharacterized protein n=1 Tax=Vigna unguiculata TaxID=3917 RepID=A0A4D6NTX3_VIGUN|nr:hypothetical protein DEO72_LG11g2216 [Vigna unguiculata]